MKLTFKKSAALVLATLAVISGHAYGNEVLAPAVKSTQGPEVTGGSLMPFSLSEETAFFDKGVVQLEQGLSYSHRTKEDKGFSLYEGGTQVNWGVTEQLQLSFQFAAYSYEDSASANGMKYDASGVMAVYSFVNPAENWLGVAVAQTLQVGPESAASDTRLALQHLGGNWSFAYNLSLQTEVGGLSGGGNDTTGAIVHTGAAGYIWDVQGSAGPLAQVSLALETEISSTYNEWQRYEGTTVYAGPTLGTAFDAHWNATLTTLIQLTDEAETPRWVVVLTVGYNF